MSPTIHSEESAGFFNMQNPKTHATRRKLFSHAFSMVSALQWEDEIVTNIQLAVRRIQNEAIAGRADLLKWWSLMTADVMSELTFGESFETLRDGKVKEFHLCQFMASFLSTLLIDVPEK